MNRRLLPALCAAAIAVPLSGAAQTGAAAPKARPAPAVQRLETAVFAGGCF